MAHTFESVGVEHAKVVRSAMDNVFGILAELDLFEVAAKRKPALSAIDVLEAMSRVKKVDSAARRRAAAAVTELPAIRDAFKALPRDRQNQLYAVRAQLRGARSLKRVKLNLDMIARQAKADGDTDLADGVRIGVSLLKAGSKTIYDPTLPFYNLGRRGVTVAMKEASSMLSNDLGAGATVGAITPGPQAVKEVAAMNAAIVASVTTAVVEVVLEEIVPLFEDIEDIVGEPA